MIMADVFKILFPVVGTLMSYVCFCLLFEGVVPAAVHRCRGVYETRPVRATFLGLIIAVPGSVTLIGSCQAALSVASVTS